MLAGTLDAPIFHVDLIHTWAFYVSFTTRRHSALDIHFCPSGIVLYGARAKPNQIVSCGSMAISFMSD